MRTSRLKYKPDASQIAIHPRWRALRVNLVEQRAKGVDASEFGMNTADETKMRSLFERVGVDPFVLASE